MFSGRESYHDVKFAGIELVPETSENFHILTQLSARDHFTKLFFFSFYSYSPIYQLVGLHTHPSIHPSNLLWIGHSLFFVYLFDLVYFLKNEST